MEVHEHRLDSNDDWLDKIGVATGDRWLCRRHPWVDMVWNAAWLVLLVVVAICSTVCIFRDRNKFGGYIGYRGVPRWVVALFGGEVERLNEPMKQGRLER